MNLFSLSYSSIFDRWTGSNWRSECFQLPIVLFLIGGQEILVEKTFQFPIVLFLIGGLEVLVGKSVFNFPIILSLIGGLEVLVGKIQH